MKTLPCHQDPLQQAIGLLQNCDFTYYIIERKCWSNICIANIQERYDNLTNQLTRCLQNFTDADHQIQILQKRIRQLATELEDRVKTHEQTLAASTRTNISFIEIKQLNSQQEQLISTLTQSQENNICPIATIIMYVSIAALLAFTIAITIKYVYSYNTRRIRPL